MATGANNPAAIADTSVAVAAAPAHAAGAADDASQQQQRQQALFEAKHAELLSEARDVAREFGVDVHAVVFRPAGGDGGAAIRHEFLGCAGREAQLKELVGRAVARDVSAMGPEELAAHEKNLQRLRAVVAHELRVKAAKANKGAAAGATSSPAPPPEAARSRG